MIHWQSIMVGGGGKLVENAGCIPDARLGQGAYGEGAKTAYHSATTDDPGKVTCPVCKCLPSWRRANAEAP